MIPKEAIEAAAAAIQVRTDQPLELDDLARLALEAAAPHMLAGAKAEALEEAAGFHTDWRFWAVTLIFVLIGSGIGIVAVLAITGQL